MFESNTVVVRSTGDSGVEVMRSEVAHRTCDQCDKVGTSPIMPIVIGSTPFDGWYTLDKTVDIFDQDRRFPADLCSIECLKAYISKVED